MGKGKGDNVKREDKTFVEILGEQWDPKTEAVKLKVIQEAFKYCKKESEKK